MCNLYPIFRYLRQFRLIVTLTSGALPSNIQLYTSSIVYTCRFYKVFGRYLICCVRIGLVWIQLLGHQLDWTGLGLVARGFGLDWIFSTQSISYSGCGTVMLKPLALEGFRIVLQLPLDGPLKFIQHRPTALVVDRLGVADVIFEEVGPVTPLLLMHQIVFLTK